MPKYYFLSDPDQTYTIGPFIIVCDTPDNYFGQVIRSNEYSEILQTNSMIFNLWSIVSTSTSVLQVKNQVQQMLKNFTKCSNIEFIGKFSGIIDSQVPILELNHNNKHYTLEFRYMDGIISCPSLTIR